MAWAIPTKKDILWVRWVHGRYLKGKSWWDYLPATDYSWYWKKLCQIRDEFKQANSKTDEFEWQGGDHYKVTKGYMWQMEAKDKVPWARIIWARLNTPSHAFISRVFMQHRLPTKKRLARLMSNRM